MAKKNTNQKIARIFGHIAELLEINSVAFKPRAYRKAAESIQGLAEDVGEVYKLGGLKALEKISGVGKSTAAKIEEYLKKKRVASYEELKEKTALREIVTHFFQTKGIPLSRLKMNARRHKIVYSRYTASAKQLLELAESVGKAKEAITKVAEWANSRGLDYSIETVSKKWLELDRLKPKKVVKKPFYRGMPLVWFEVKKKWFVVTDEGEWLEFAGEEKDIEWRIT